LVVAYSWYEGAMFRHNKSIFCLALFLSFTAVKFDDFANYIYLKYIIIFEVAESWF